jgi:TonB-linked SusC/RagA family outer membrane protein
MRKFTMLIAFLLFVGMRAALAQFEVKGTVTDAKDGTPLPGVSIIVKGTLTGTVTDAKGNYTLTVPEGHNDMIFSFIGMLTKEVKIDGRAKIDVALQEDVVGLDEVVVTALGISREKKSLGYSTQEVSGSDVNTVKSDNFVNSLSGKVSGVQIKSTGNLGGSSNVIIRGYSSLQGNNQALFVVDGVPIDNSNTNNDGQLRGRNGYDYGNAASDINPNDIESINILKGAAATALYGSRAANGVVMITTKKGAKAVPGKKRIGVTINSNVTTGFVDKSTFPKYQNQYGAGYGSWGPLAYSDTVLANGQSFPGFEYLYDVNGDGTLDWTVPTYDDASMGQKFDPNVMVYQWDSYYAASPNYKKATPWKAADNGPFTFFQTPWQFTNSVDIAGGGDAATFRLGYTNQDGTGIMPNSRLVRDNFTFNGSYDILKNLTVTASANLIKTNGLGRNSTGYSDNILSSFRQWMQTNVDYKEQKDLYDKTNTNITWNPKNPNNLAPAYWDNPYWVRFQNYETDARTRIISYVQADWKMTSYLSLMGRASIDTYDELQEERKAVGSASGEFGVDRNEATSGYSRFTRSFYETNFDLMLKFNKDLSESFNLSAYAGTNIRRSKNEQVFASTDGGLIVPNYYYLGNTKNQNPQPAEKLEKIGVNGYYVSASLGFKNLLYLDGSYRIDQSSTLPSDKRTYPYGSISASFLFHNLLNADWLQLGKLRLGYATVGNSAPWGKIRDTYVQNTTFAGTALFSVPNTKNNQELKPERTASLEAGLEMKFLQSRLGFDLSFYKNNTTNQILPVAVSYATGYSGKYVNAGEIENKGVELNINGVPVQMENFRWDINLNWAKNDNRVVKLEEGLENLQLASLQGGVTINARVGEPFGTIQGTDYVYLNGEKVIGSNGYYLRTSTSDIVLGNINPDWTGGINNRFTYKNWALSFLIDWQQGGSVFSLDLWYGMGTGLYEETVGNNDLGNPLRDPIVQNEDGTYASNSGGVLLEGVLADGTPNTKRVHGDDYRVFGWSQNPNAGFVYDASYVKLREVVISYSIPEKVMNNVSWLAGATFSLVGSNLWIISKNLPHADPEASQSSGNVQGWQSGVMPTTRNIGLTVNLQF